MRFRTRLTLVLLTVVIISQLATGIAFLRATQNDALTKGNQRLEVGARVFEQLLNIRGEQLLGNVAILAEDFGFKSAVATQDTATLYSVLANHGDRAKADLVMLSDLNGNVLASSHHAQAQRHREYPHQSGNRRKSPARRRSCVRDIQGRRRTLASASRAYRREWRQW